MNGSHMVDCSQIGCHESSTIWKHYVLFRRCYRLEGQGSVDVLLEFMRFLLPLVYCYGLKIYQVN